MFLLLKENFLSRGSSWIIKTLAQWHCLCTEIPDEINPLMTSSAELWSILSVPQRIKIQDKVEFEGNFRFFILHNKFWIASPGIPKFNALYLEKYSDQTSSYLVMFDIKESPINKIFESESWKKFWISKFLIPTKLTAPSCWDKVVWYFHFEYWLCIYGDLSFVDI